MIVSSKKAISTREVAQPSGVWSQGIEAEGKRLLFISGQTSEDRDGNVVARGDIVGQTRQCLENMRKVLETAAATLDNVVKVTVFVTDMSGWADVHRVRAEYFQQPYPASTLVQVAGLYREGLLIEIEAIAVVD